jgi:hypothetical protein
MHYLPPALRCQLTPSTQIHSKPSRRHPPFTSPSPRHPPRSPPPALWGLIVATIATFYPVIGPGLALGLLLPYLVWVTYASALTIWLWRNNVGKQVRAREMSGRGGA